MSDELEKAYQAEFDQYVTPRRAKAGIAGDPEGSWGLALSGGGIRSATFCLGLLRGMAKNQILKRFDYLSTVSGGGYVGASLGRLYGNGGTAKEVEDGVASDRSMWLWWLRNNGRYLTPAGAKDLGFAGASIIRGIVATHLEIGILLLLLAAAVLLPHALIAISPPQEELSWWSLDLFGSTNSIWWWLLPIPAFCFAHQLVGYWYTKDQRTLASVTAITLSSALGAYLAFELGRTGFAEFEKGLATPEKFSAAKTLLSLSAALLLSATVTAWLTTAIDWAFRTPISEVRLARTKRLAYSLWAMAIVAGIACLDALTWRVAGLFWEWEPGRFPVGKTALVGLLLALGRFALPEIQKRMETAKKRSLSTEKALNALGTLLAIAILVFWTSLLHITLFSTWAWAGAPALGQTALGLAPLQTLGMLVTICGLYLVLSCKSFELLNLASLHNFYRARIERAYVSSGNAASAQGPEVAANDQAKERFPRPAFQDTVAGDTLHVAPLTEAIKGDDIELTDYAPHTHGGPIHLINCCINQSVDDRTGIYNADRKGIALTVSSVGVEIGTGFAKGSQYANPPGKLSRWIAISGAAASTGMGSRTTPGFAALLFLSGIRLGYWTQSLITQQHPLRRGGAWFRKLVVGLAPKPLAIIAESMARFPGLSGAVWYVSDGGHFDNTGIYALLKRNCRVIVAADCGADPKYLFADLESLVRKAKIDYAATIEFVDPDLVSIKICPELRALLGTPETVTPDAGSRWLVLGRIRYCNGSEGALVIVKPRRLDKMPFDIVAYADRNPDFPQQTTGDQFFDEAQWEAYHQLGTLMGARIARSLLKNAVAAVEEMTAAPSSLVTAEVNNAAQTPKESRRNRVGLTVKASLGAGISLSLILALWQGFEKYRDAKLIEDKEYSDKFVQLSESIGDPEKLGRLTSEHFRRFAEQSKSRGDDHLERLRKMVRVECARRSNSPPLDQIACNKLYRDMENEPVQKYSYWFKENQEEHPVPSPEEDSDGKTSPAKGKVAIQIIYTPIGANQSPGNPIVVRQAASRDDAQHSTTAAGASERPAEPAATPAPPPAPALNLQVPQEACNPKGGHRARVYIHIYDEATRPQAEGIADKAARQLSIAVPPIENVTRTASSNGKNAPYQWARPAIIYHGGVSPACIVGLRAATAASDVVVKGLPAAYKSNPGMIELWLPSQQ